MRIFVEGALGMDLVFCQFEKWFQSKLSEWAQKGVTVEKFGLGISFVDITKLDDYEKEFINHITWNGNEG